MNQNAVFSWLRLLFQFCTGMELQAETMSVHVAGALGLQFSTLYRAIAS